MARGEVTGKKCGPRIPDYQQQTDNIPFDERLFTSKQTQEILAEGKTIFLKKACRTSKPSSTAIN